MKPKFAINASQERSKARNNGFWLGDWKNSLTATTAIAKMSNSSSQMIC